MDVGGLSIYMNQNRMAGAVQLALAKKVMDVSESNAQQMIQMLKTSVDPNIGQNIDIIA